MRFFPALDLSWPALPDDEIIDRLLAELDEARPTAVETHTSGVRIFFGTASQRDRAAELAAAFRPTPQQAARLVPDDDWAERSQAAITAVRIGRVIVRPPWADVAADPPAGAIAASPGDAGAPPADIVITIQPSMGFGTGHHPSTRLCLHLLQQLPLAGASVLDVGTGSGVLAIAAWRLGAAAVTAIDADPDALQSAAENIGVNGADQAVALRLVDISNDASPVPGAFDCVIANLTGAMLERERALLAAWLGPAGSLVASGFEMPEVAGVEAAFAAAGLARHDRAVENGWVALTFRRI